MEDIVLQHVAYLEGARWLVAAGGYKFEPEVKAVKNNRKLQIQASLPYEEKHKERVQKLVILFMVLTINFLRNHTF